MKAIFLIAILLLSFLFDLQAQIQLKAGFDLSIYNPSANQFFDRYQDIDHIVMYNVGDDEILDIYPKVDLSYYHPIFKGDILKLTRKLEQKFKQWKPIVVTDSIIIMTGIVDKKGVIGKLQLIEGRTSAYSNKVLDFVSGEVTSWCELIKMNL